VEKNMEKSDMRSENLNQIYPTEDIFEDVDLVDPQTFESKKAHLKVKYWLEDKVTKKRVTIYC
jgi:hypothetical protein